MSGSSDESDHLKSGQPYVSLVRLSGVIMPESHMAASTVNPVLSKAFADKKSKGVLIVMNSPGGSAVQSSLIYDQIMQLKHQFHKKVVVVGEDSLTSGAYLIASAADITRSDRSDQADHGQSLRTRHVCPMFAYCPDTSRWRRDKLLRTLLGSMWSNLQE